MTAPELDSAPPPTPVVHRILFGLGGVVVLIGGGIVTLGVALLGSVAIGVAWLVLRYRRRKLTRGVAWLVSAGATAALFLGVFGFAALSMKKQSPEVTAREMAEARARSRDSMPAWLKAVSASSARSNPAADSVAQKLSANPVVILWLGAVGAIFTAAIIGSLAGTIGWGGVMLLYRAVERDWMPPGGPIAT